MEKEMEETNQAEAIKQVQVKHREVTQAVLCCSSLIPYSLILLPHPPSSCSHSRRGSLG